MSDVRWEAAAATVVLGCVVRVRDAEGEHEHTVVSGVTADTPPGCVSVASPVGRALVGRRRGDQVTVQTPDGVRLLTIVGIAAPAASPPRSPRPCVE